MPIWLLWLGWASVVVLSAALRTRLYAAFSAVVLGLVTFSWSALGATWQSALPEVFFAGSICWPVVALQLVTWLHFLSLIRPRLRSWPFRLLVTWPGLWVVAASWLSAPWAVAALLGLPPWGWWLPFLAATYGLWESLVCRLESVGVRLDPQAIPGTEHGLPERAEVTRRAGLAVAGSSGDAFRIVHLTDPHLGALVSPARLRAACRDIVESRPDLVAITGDFLTMESQREPERLAWSLEPLKELDREGVPLVACNGNHDLEAPSTVQSACSAAGIQLLVDDGVLLSMGKEREGRIPRRIHVVGLDYRFSESPEELADRLSGERQRSSPESEAATVGADLVLALAHAPSSFRRLLPVLETLSPNPHAPTITLSGHLHGGQLGLLRFGIDWTILRLSRQPAFEHGLWRAGRHHLYSSRGFGHYGFPFRIGVPAELSVLELTFDGWQSRSSR